MAAQPVPPSNLPQRTRPEDAALHITVSDPVQHSEGMNKYTSYRVDVRPTASPSPNDASSTAAAGDVFQNASYSAVLRRYSDFLWLYERLHKERAGAIVPPLPEKQAVARFSAAFVEDRRINLERFLRRVAVHPELSDAPSLDTFLRADDVTFHAAKKTKNGDMMAMSVAPSAQTLTPPKKEGIKRWFAEAKTSLGGDLVKSPDDDLFEEIERYVHGLDHQMKSVSHQASGLVRKGKEIANGLFEFGLAFNLLGQSEADGLGDALGKMGETADRLSVLSAEHAEREMAQFEQPLQDYIKMIHAVKLALQRRHEKRLTYTTCLSEVTTKRSNLAKLRAQPGQEGKAYGAEMSLRRGEAAADAARDEFATVSQRVLREVDRFKREKAEDMRRTVLDYITLQVEHNRRMEEIWGGLIPQLERVQLENPGGGNANAPTPAVPTTAEQQSPGQVPQQGQQPIAPPQPQQQKQMPNQPQQQQAMQPPPPAVPPPHPTVMGGAPMADPNIMGAAPMGGAPDPNMMGQTMGGVQYRSEPPPFGM